ncbi:MULTISPECIES: SDR family oxidoreductase [Bacillaceae]|uniref:SDR family oxidoreductase n=1 Tax=Psychrobacillus lasiicapitis TaxID=1636719 RepID=A0A544SWR0_9BACI|nr:MULTISPECIES: SDR family oxidoreductase [Bacillaceae]QEY22955.1 SDR family oxidoreductase [Psychrobacillus sp. AK 1817]TQR09636.1 SDR family oxidoreductase [Psychrobacillus lasiicapitis]GGA49633.1 oxidoreductase [Psychrobacillus lasiicapitis]
MTVINGKVVVITGASSGIGETTARLLASLGAHVVIGARRVERLEVLASDIKKDGGSVVIQQLDVTEMEQMQAIIEVAQSRFGRVDAVINNAGVMPLSSLEALKIKEWNRMIDVNIRGVLHGIASGLPVMKKQGFGHFINIASIGAYEVSPTAAVYCATKYAVRAITDGLRQETAGQGIRVTLISPGVTESELAESITDNEAKEIMKEYRRTTLPATAIARAIVYALEQPEYVDVSELVIKPVI